MSAQRQDAKIPLQVGTGNSIKMDIEYYHEIVCVFLHNGIFIHCIRHYTIKR